MCNILFDLDGTLIDSSNRLYNLFSDLIKKSKFTKDEYWNFKRNKINHEMIIQKFFPEENFEEFNEKWLSLIETEKYLLTDKLYPDINICLKKLQQKNKLWIVTARQDKQAVIREIERFGIKQYFEKILVTELKTTKSEIIKENIEINADDFFIGDTGVDILEAKKCGLKTIALTRGFLAEDVLKKYNPDYIYNSLSDCEVLY